MWLFTVSLTELLLLTMMVAAQQHCDPLTQYELQGHCCKMCPPGTMMSLQGSCQDPLCKECGEDEYQDSYTTASRCKRQQYCDPNKNFQVAVEKSRTEQSTCVCKVGFHCSSDACLTCVPHTTCEPGWGAQPKGNHSHDTVCQKCPVGSFSKERSWEKACEKWTECEEGFYAEQPGTDESDNSCAKSSQAHTIALCIVALVIVIGVIAGWVTWRCRGTNGDSRLKNCLESCLGRTTEPQILIDVTTPTPDDDASSRLRVVQPSDDTVFGTPVETEDELQGPSCGLLTNQGNIVAQEDGKPEVLSRQESQTQPFTD